MDECSWRILGLLWLLVPIFGIVGITVWLRPQLGTVRLLQSFSLCLTPIGMMMLLLHHTIEPVLLITGLQAGLSFALGWRMLPKWREHERLNRSSHRR